MNIELIGFIIGTIGKVMVAYTAIMVHHRFWKEHKIDDDVFSAMKRERQIGLTGIFLIILGAALEVFVIL